MKLNKFWKKLKAYLLNILQPAPPKISLLIPFNGTDEQRKRVFKWLRKYWKYELPEAEVVIGKSSISPFCKTNALNNAVSKSKGKILVMIDADAYISGAVITKCADRILEDLDNHLWYVPYRKLYRLTKGATEAVISSRPSSPLRLSFPLNKEFIDGDQAKSAYGHRYGAMIMIFPREAYEILGCFDERFRGWGAEDVCLLRALDTLWGKHKTSKNAVYHLWHPIIGSTHTTRQWEGQQEFNPNNKLAMLYHKATNHPTMMRNLVDEGCKQLNN